MTPENPSRNDNEKRLFLALILSTGVLLITPYFFRYMGLEQRPEPVEPILEEVYQEQAFAPLLQSTPTAATAIASGEETETGEISGPSRTFSLFNEDLEIRVATQGGVFESIRLLKYLDDDGQPLELIAQDSPAEVPRPLALEASDPILQGKLEKAVYRVSPEPQSRTGTPQEYTFTYQSGPLKIERRIQLPVQGYEIGLSTRVSNAGSAVAVRTSLGAGIGALEAATTTDFLYPKVSVQRGGAVAHYYVDDLEEAVFASEAGWVSVDGQYFARVLLADGLVDVQAGTASRVLAEGEETPLVVASAASATGTSRLFLGPKATDVLRGIDPTLHEIVDYGMFEILVKPLLFLLRAVYSVVGNYGFSIIILTFLINVVLIPIRYKQIVSMQKMSALQPKMKEIQNRYKKAGGAGPKKEEMNKEVMALYQEHGVNPLGSCLPLLVQMPFLIAFYQMLAGSIDLRGAPFILWIQDLSRYDPYFVTPILMGITMVAQQKMTPGGGDPSQRRMMMMMPVVFTVFFLWVASGLALYFLFSNVFGIVFQVGVQKVSPELSRKPEPRKSTPKSQSRGHSK